MAACPFNPASENIADFIFRYGSRQQIPGNPADIPCMDYVSQDYAVIYTPLESVALCGIILITVYPVSLLF